MIAGKGEFDQRFGHILGNAHFALFEAEFQHPEVLFFFVGKGVEKMD